MKKSDKRKETEKNRGIDHVAPENLSVVKDGLQAYAKLFRAAYNGSQNGILRIVNNQSMRIEAFYSRFLLPKLANYELEFFRDYGDDENTKKIRAWEDSLLIGFHAPVVRPDGIRGVYIKKSETESHWYRLPDKPNATLDNEYIQTVIATQMIAELLTEYTTIYTLLLTEKQLKKHMKWIAQTITSLSRIKS